MALSTYCITSSGLLCLFNSSRQLEAWVNLKVSEGKSMCACGGAPPCVFISDDMADVPVCLIAYLYN